MLTATSSTSTARRLQKAQPLGRDSLKPLDGAKFHFGCAGNPHDLWLVTCDAGAGECRRTRIHKIRVRLARLSLGWDTLT